MIACQPPHDGSKIAGGRRDITSRLYVASVSEIPGEQRKIEARFGEANPVYRPDQREIAYWEIEIEGVETVLPVPEGEAKQYDKGFIVVATGAHDVPIPHFSLSQAPPSRQLDVLGDIDRVVKLDSLCYAGQDKAGNLVAHPGTRPPKPHGPPPELPRTPPRAAPPHRPSLAADRLPHAAPPHLRAGERPQAFAANR